MGDDGRRSSQPAGPAREARDPSRLYARIFAGLVLIPSVPLLLLSSGALALFYVAPTRFGALLARLPGDQYLRSALAFAPAALLALVVLATLYLLEGVQPGARGLPAAPLEETRPSKARERSSARLAGRLFAPALPILALSLAVALLAFAMPDHFWEFLGDLPGQRYLRRLIPLAPLIVGFPSVLLGMLSLRGMSQIERWNRASRLRRSLPTYALGIAGLMLLASLLLLGLFALAPDPMEALLARLPAATVLRSQLALAPVLLLAVVALAALPLLGGAGSWHPEVASAGAFRSTGALLTIGSMLLLAMLTSLGYLAGAALLLLR